MPAIVEHWLARGLAFLRLLGVAILLASSAIRAVAASVDAPNVVPIDDHLVTSGQPTPASLKHLRAEGFEAVVYLAPFSVPDAVADEPQILRGQDIEFVHVPIRFDAPTAADVQAVGAALERLKGRRTLVHCQVNMRASTMTFLYRVLQRGESPQAAWSDVTKVWVPRGPWQRLVNSELSRHGIEFDPF